MIGVALLLQQLQREGDVLRGQGAAVMEAGLRPQQKPVGQAVGGDLHGARGQAIDGIGLVMGGGEYGGRAHEGREGEVDALGGIALENEGIERIEREVVLVELAHHRELREHAAFGRVRIDVVEMLEVGRIFEVAEGRHAMMLGLLLLRAAPDAHHDGRDRSGPEHERVAAIRRSRARRPEPHWREPVLAALAWSHHQIVGNSVMPYFGIGSGWLKRSQRAVGHLPLVYCGTT